MLKLERLNKGVVQHCDASLRSMYSTVQSLAYYVQSTYQYVTAGILLRHTDERSGAIESVSQVKESEERERGSLEGWLNAAYESFVQSGVNAVRIAPLSKRLELSRTSFYWFFKDREELLDALLARWRSKNTGQLVKQTQAYAENISEAVFNVFDCWFDETLFDSRFEFAVRSWAQQSPDIAAEIDSADTERVRALTRMFMRFGYNTTSADVRAQALYLTQVGYISSGIREDLASRMNRIPTYVEIFSGTAPQKRDVDRFYARHGYVAHSPAIAK